QRESCEICGSHVHQASMVEPVGYRQHPQGLPLVEQHQLAIRAHAGLGDIAKASVQSELQTGGIGINGPDAQGLVAAGRDEARFRRELDGRHGASVADGEAVQQGPAGRIPQVDVPVLTPGRTPTAVRTKSYTANGAAMLALELTRL